ncbi:uncharacterized protein METZ01_LOCUS424665, partial [marine metagenome]
MFVLSLKVIEIKKLFNHFPNLKLVNDGGTVGMKEAP